MVTFKHRCRGRNLKLSHCMMFTAFAFTLLVYFKLFLLVNKSFPILLEDNGPLSDPTKHYAVWLYDSFPPMSNIVSNDIIVCAYEACRKAYVASMTFNLRNLSLHTRFEDFIKSHSLHVILMGDKYPHHIQSVALLLIAGHENHSCARTIGSPRKDEICFDRLTKFDEYNPLDSEPHLVPFFPATQQEKYGILDMQSRVRKVPVANSGDEMQGFAGAQLVPYVNEFVDRDRGASTAKSWILMNAWWGAHFEWPPNLDESHPTLTSMHYSAGGKKVVESNVNWFKEYNAKIGAVGARDTGTLAFLKSLGISTYFSACHFDD